VSFDAIIKTLRDNANKHMKDADEGREHAARYQETANELAAEADKNERAARDFGLLADALATGQLTKDQLRAIVTEANADAQGAADDGLLPDPLVMDADEYYASIWTGAIATASTAQLEGVACINCARVFGDEPNYPAATGPRGQLFAHSHPDDCKGVAL